MGRLVNLNGALLPPDRAHISVFDRGFLYGDSIYEVVRTYGGRVFELEAHLDRLERSATRIGMALPWPRAELEHQLDLTLLAAALPGEAYARLVITRGEGEISLDPALAERPTVVILVQELHPPPEETYQQGVRVELVGVRRNLREALDPAAKTGNYLNSILALREAKATGAYEGLMLNREGQLTEGSTSNVFVVKGGALATPPLEAGILEGVTRRVVLNLASQLGIPAAERPLLPEDLLGADEAFLTSTIREVLPITRVGERPVGAGAPGPVTLRLLSAFRERARKP
jgi:branched-chain amino acid aminotransferase